jgi:hypothetical protein
VFKATLTGLVALGNAGGRRDELDGLLDRDDRSCRRTDRAGTNRVCRGDITSLDGANRGGRSGWVNRGDEQLLVADRARGHTTAAGVGVGDDAASIKKGRFAVCADLIFRIFVSLDADDGVGSLNFLFGGIREFFHLPLNGSGLKCQKRFEDNIQPCAMAVQRGQLKSCVLQQYD